MKRPMPSADRLANMPLVSDAVRKAMVQRVAQQGVRDPLVLAALEKVPRHYFLEPGLAPQAYVDASLPIGYHQTISQPYIVARMIEVLREGVSGKLKRVLEIGTGCGYQCALLAQLSPQQVEDWYLAIYVDAIEWVELPNTHGMALFADGGVLVEQGTQLHGSAVARLERHQQLGVERLLHRRRGSDLDRALGDIEEQQVALRGAHGGKERRALVILRLLQPV